MASASLGCKTFKGSLVTFFSFLAMAGSLAAADFQNGQAADVVLGQPDFKSSEAPLGQIYYTSYNVHVARDPQSGKVFISDYLNHRILRYSSAAAAQPTGGQPEAVFGQSNFVDHLPNQGAENPTAQKLAFPSDLYMDDAGRLWVADSNNNRVLRYDNAANLGNNPSADQVYGQDNFLSKNKEAGLGGLNFPQGVTVGPGNALWVADTNNNRVLRFPALGPTTQVLGVLGQADFSGTTASDYPYFDRMNGPEGLVADNDGRLWVSDTDNSRVLRFENAAQAANGAACDGMLGQGNTDATNVDFPYGLYLDAAGNLWVGDFGNDRVLRFNTPLVDNSAANLVLGQENFDENIYQGVTAKSISGGEDIASGPDGSVLIADNHRVLRFSPTDNLPPQFDFTISQAATPSSVLIGETLTYTVTAHITTIGIGGNASPIVRFQFPTGVQFDYQGVTVTNGYTAAVDATGITFTGGTLSTNGEDTATFTIQIIPQAAGTLVSPKAGVMIDPSDDIDESIDSNNTAPQGISTTVSVEPPPPPQFDLTINQAVTPSPVTVGNPLTYTLTAHIAPDGGTGGNASPVIRFEFPTGVPVNYKSSTVTNGYMAAVDATGVTFTGGTISTAGGDTATLTIVVTPQASGVLSSIGTNVKIDPGNLIDETNNNNNTAQDLQTTISLVPVEVTPIVTYAAPVVKINKKKIAITTQQAKFTVKGSTFGVATSVIYRVGKKGGFKLAKGIVKWSFKAKLKLGKNRIIVKAIGPGGVSIPAKITIIRN